MAIATHQNPKNKKIGTVLFRIILVVVLLEVGLRISGNFHLNYRHNLKKISINQTDTYKIVVFGDSISYGGSAWPSLLEGILNNKNPEMKFSVVNEAVEGYTTSHILAQLDNLLNKSTPDIVIIMSGIRDLNDEILQKGGIIGNFIKDLRIYKFSHHLFSSLVKKAGDMLSDYTKFQTKDQNESKILEQYIVSGREYLANKDAAKAERMFKKTIYAHLENEEGIEVRLIEAHIELTKLYLVAEGLNETVEKLEAYGNIQRFGKLTNVYFELVANYLNQNRSEDAEKILGIIKKINPNILITVYTKLGNSYQATDDKSNFLKKADEIRRSHYNPTTQSNFKKIYEMTKNKNAKLVIVQYPTIDTENLKSIFSGDEDIIFVSNKENFESTLRIYNYSTLFRDKDYATFGHTNPLGSTLIAETVATAILEEFNEID